MPDVDSMHARHHDAIAGEGRGWMAAAGAAIGFALHGLPRFDWDTSLLMASLAIICWCGSFAAGIFRQAIHTATLQASLLHAAFNQAGIPPAQTKPFRDKHDERANAQVKWRGWQLWLLFAGALAFLGAEIITARDRSNGPAAERCLAIQRDMLSARPRRADSPDLFQALGCRPQGEGNVYAAPIGRATRSR